jgi:serine/threonine-protein kinase
MSSSAVLSPGLVVAGRYRIEETLAGEGSAALLRATDTRAERGVVLRMLPLAGGDDGERCTRQGKLAARLTHPNLARVLDFGTDEAAGVRYVAAELGEGGTLAALLAQRGAPPLPIALRMLQEAAAGLAAAHAAGAVHGDLHPGMLWLSRGGGKLRMEVLGLGMDAAGAPPARATARYSSPERLRRARDLAPAADVFSLGAIAYEVLAGLPAEWMRLLVAMAKGQPAVVPSPLAVKPDMPPELADAVLRAVSASPADRWCDAGEFAASLAVPVAIPAARASAVIPLAINVVREPEPEPRAAIHPARRAHRGGSVGRAPRSRGDHRCRGDSACPGSRAGGFSAGDRPRGSFAAGGDRSGCGGSSGNRCCACRARMRHADPSGKHAFAQSHARVHRPGRESPYPAVHRAWGGGVRSPACRGRRARPCD